MADPRTAAVEDNLVSFFGVFDDSPVSRREPWDDVDAYWSDVPFPLFNPVVGARFAPGTEAERAAAVVGRYVERGRPFLWWTTPSTSSPALEAALTAAGMAREEIPGMHLALDGPPGDDVPALPAGAEILAVDPPAEPEPFVTTMLAGFGMPPELADPFREVLQRVDDGPMVSLLATLDGVPAATATGWLSGDVIGVYNVATLEGFRGRGLGGALTAAVVAEGRRRGATQAVLHSSEMGRPVYERLGFEAVCEVPQFVWVPSA